MSFSQLYRSKRILVALVFILVFAMTSADVGNAQSAENAAGKRAPTKKKTTDANSQPIRIIYLKHAAARDVGETLDNVLAGSKIEIVVDDRLNALFIKSKSDAVSEKRIHDLIQVLDAPTPPVAESKSKTISVHSATTRDLVKTLQGLELNVEAAALTEEMMLLRGDRESVQSAQELVETILQDAEQASASKDVSVELFWATEASVPGGRPFEGKLAEQLKKRGFKPLTVLCETEVATVVGSSASVMSEALAGTMILQLMTQKAGKKIEMELEVVARTSSEKRGGIEFTTTLTTPLNRFVVFGVAQRKSDDDKMYRDVFLIRLKEQAALEQ